jgi:hypothetical protein
MPINPAWRVPNGATNDVGRGVVSADAMTGARGHGDGARRAALVGTASTRGFTQMTSSTATPVSIPVPGGSRLSTVAAIVAAVSFSLMGLIFVAVGMAFPLALSVVAQQHLLVSASDLALAQQLAPFWPVFVAAGALSFVAALAVLDGGHWGKRIAVVIAGTGTLLAIAVGIMLVVGGGTRDALDVANGVGIVYLVALATTVAVQVRRAA